MAATRSREDLWAELEGIGEDEVRINLRTIGVVVNFSRPKIQKTS